MTSLWSLTIAISNYLFICLCWFYSSISSWHRVTVCEDGCCLSELIVKVSTIYSTISLCPHRSKVFFLLSFLPWFLKVYCVCCSSFFSFLFGRYWECTLFVFCIYRTLQRTIFILFLSLVTFYRRFIQPSLSTFVEILYNVNATSNSFPLQALPPFYLQIFLNWKKGNEIIIAWQK